jgi:hypothetical protein
MRFEPDPIPVLNLNDRDSAVRNHDHIYLVRLPARTDAMHKIGEDIRLTFRHKNPSLSPEEG